MKAFLAMGFIAALAASPLYADCAYPPVPEKLPDGASATLEEMLAGQKTVNAYQKAVNEYIACIDKDLESALAKAGDKLKPQQKVDMQKIEAQKHNAAVDQMQSVADRFNEQVKVYKTRTSDKKG